MRYWMARWIARFVCFFNARRRQVIVDNLTPLVGAERARQVAPELLGNFLMTAVDFFCSRPQRSRAATYTYEGWSRIEEAYSENRRLIIMTAHMGNWEGGITSLIDRGFPVAGLYATYTDDDIVDWITSHRNPQVHWIPTTPGAADICVAALEQGRILCLAADIPYGEHGRRVTIAGRTTRMPLGPWAIALRAKATVLPAIVLRRAPGKYFGVIHEPIKPNNDSLKQQMIRMQEIYRSTFEDYLKAYPEQWGNLQPYWERS
jgi:KDO2-lipid IV(A) lauroyltransferase